jgi:hypothetical protein
MLVLAILGIAGIGYYLYSQSSGPMQASALAAAQLRAIPPVIGSYPAAQGNALGAIANSQVIGNTVDAGAAASTSFLKSSASAVPLIGPAIGAAVQVFNQLWAAHTARLKGATTENQAVPVVVPIFDAAIQAIATSWNATHDQADCISALTQLQQNTYAYLKGRVGAPGTAWKNTPPFPCDSSCTVGCCLYWSDFISDPSTVGGSTGFGITGMIAAIQAGGNKTVTIQKVYASKYQNFSRPLYTVTLT